MRLIFLLIICLPLLASSEELRPNSGINAFSNSCSQIFLDAVPTVRIGPDEIGIFAYGSLLNAESFSNTLGRRYEGQVTAGHLNGFTRTWNAAYPNKKYHGTTSNGIFTPKHILFLNIVPKADAYINGMIFVVKKTDIPGYDSREEIYQSTVVTNQVSGVRVEGGDVITYVGKQEFLAPDNPSSLEDYAVRNSYIEIYKRALDLARQTNPMFVEEFERTTEPVPSGLVFDDFKSPAPAPP